MPGLEQPVDQGLPGTGGLVLLERLDLSGSRRQADQVIIGPANQGLLARRGGRPEPILLEPGENKRVNRVFDPLAILDGRNSWALHRLVGPPGSILSRNCGGLLRSRLAARRLRAGSPGNPHLHPANEQVNLSLGKLPLGRHLVLIILIGDHLENQALVEIIETDSRADNPAPEHIGP